MYNNFEVISFICSGDGVGKFHHISKDTKRYLFEAMRQNCGFTALTQEQFDECFSVAVNLLGFVSKD